MKKPSTEGPAQAPKTLQEVLEEEFAELNSDYKIVDSPCAALRSAHLTAVAEAEALAELEKRTKLDTIAKLAEIKPLIRADPARKARRAEWSVLAKLRRETVSALKAKQAECAKLEREYWDKLTELLRTKTRSALCFSGGGIRSATFGLGVLQGLSHHHLLGEFNYLSTVSGGGYIGSWLSAWRKRGDSIHQIEEDLRAKPKAKLDGERPEIGHLRSYSNYLTPRLGFFSADTWTLIATVIRNMFLNWMILVPILAGVLLVPKLAHAILLALPGNVYFLWAILWIGAVAAVFAVSQIGRFLPSGGNRPCTETQYWWWVLFPLSISAVFLNTFWAAWLRLQASNPIPWWGYVGFGAILHFTGWFFVSDPDPDSAKSVAATGSQRYMAAIGSRAAKVATTSQGLFSIPAIATGAAGGWAAYELGNLEAINPGEHSELVVCLGFPLVMLIYFFSAALFIGFTSKTTKDDDREWWARSGGWILIVSTGWAAASALVIGGPHLIAWAGAKVSAAGGLVGLGSGALGSLGGKSAGTTASKDAAADQDKTIAVFSSQWFLNLGLKIAPLVFLLALLLAISELADFILGKEIAPRFPHKEWIHAAEVLIFIGLGMGLGGLMARYVNVNTFSLHGMYRNRLIRAYLGAARSVAREKTMNVFTGFDEKDNFPIHTLPSGKPFHILNMCLNLVHGERLAWQERKAETFTVSRLHSGSARLGYQDSENYGDRPRDGKPTGITLGTAMAISGAAASPNMGYHSSPLVGFVMTFFNARLGWWLANPGDPGKEVWTERGPKSALKSLFAEALGNTDDKNPYVYLSDGGHFENLGLYEMVLRRCDTIVVIDAGADPQYQFEDLANAVRKIRVDLGVTIHFDKPLNMHSGEAAGNVHCATATICYDCIDGGHAHRGTLIYIKPVLEPMLSVDLDQYHSAHSKFPQQSTADQWFDEAQFESYRRLGLETIDSICENRFSRVKMTLTDFVSEAKAHKSASKRARTQC